jgi:hypothetical protein
VGNLRLVLDVQMCSGKQSSSGYAKAHLARLPGELGDKGPALVRGDCGYGNQDIIEVCEAAQQLPKFDCWQALVRYISDKITGQSVLPSRPPVVLALR